MSAVATAAAEADAALQVKPRALHAVCAGSEPTGGATARQAAEVAVDDPEAPARRRGRCSHFPKARSPLGNARSGR